MYTGGGVCMYLTNGYGGSFYILMKCTAVVLTGYQCEQYNNPADFFLDVIIENEETDNGIHVHYNAKYAYMHIYVHTKAV